MKTFHRGILATALGVVLLLGIPVALSMAAAAPSPAGTAINYNPNLSAPKKVSKAALKKHYLKKGKTKAYKHAAAAKIACSTCHTNPHRSYPVACNSCHNSTKTWATRHAPTTSGTTCQSCHRPIGEYWDAHPQANCASCHTPKRAWKNATHTLYWHCGDCHAYPAGHAAYPNTSCQTCHRSTGIDWKFDHNTGIRDCAVCHEKDRPTPTHFTAGSIGSELDCYGCHNTTSWTRTGSHPVTFPCNWCHLAPHDSYVLPAYQPLTDCSTCHQSPGGTSWAFTHPVTSGLRSLPCTDCHVAPNANHPQAGCQTCHSPAVPFASTPHPSGTNCLSCHGDTTALHASAIPTACTASCHTAYGGNLASSHASCATCHGSSDPKVVTAIRTGDKDCFACHDRNVHDNPHTVVRSDACVTCHAGTTLYAVHGDAKCALCHGSSDPAVVAAIHGGNAACASCHAVNPHAEIHETATAAQCPTCHAPPTGHPAGLACTDCHEAGTAPWTDAAHPAQTAACGSCHTPPADHYADRCSTCHNPAVPFGNTVDPHDAPVKDCLTCHTPPSNHPAGLTCPACHAVGTAPWSEATHPSQTATCTSCHTAPVPHFGTTGNDCAKCHDPGTPFTATVGPHVAGAVCITCHATPTNHPTGLTCLDCHTAGTKPWTAAAHPSQTAACVTCHTPPVAHFGSTGNDCATCHSPAVPFSVTVDPHVARTDCVTCHAVPASHPAGLVCTTCHTAPGTVPWAAATHPAQATACASCHVPPVPHFGNTGSDCVVCHNPAVPFATTADPHATRTDCTTCHALPSNHPNGLVCSTCHTAPGTAPWTSATHPAPTAACATCHTAPRNHFGTTGTDCAKCHDSAVPFASTTDPHGTGTACVTCHTAPTDHPAGLVCTTCHTEPGSTPWTDATHPDQSAACASCHTAPTSHFGNTGTDCATCHSPAVPFPATVDPHVARTDCTTCHAAPDGHPAGLACQTCHTAPGSSPWTAASHPDQSAACAACHTPPTPHFGNDGTDCATCHSPAVPFAETPDPHVIRTDCVTCHVRPTNHPTGLVCTTCHTAPGASPWTAAEHPAQTAACATCHTAPVAHFGNTGTDCAVCHNPAVPFAATTDPHGARTDCVACHAVPAGHPTGLTCTTCHTSPGASPWTAASHPGQTAACTACHTPPPAHFGTTGSDCAVCHASNVPFAATTDPHAARTDCLSCHATPGSHPAGLTCTTCHTAPGAAPWTAATHPAATSTCSACHTPPTGHDHGTLCGTCHTPASGSWAFQHPGDSTKCVACHTAAEIATSHASCVDCHSGHNDTWSGVPDATSDCVSCHSGTAWTHTNTCYNCHTSTELSALGLRNQAGQPYHPWTYTIGAVHDGSILSGKCTQCHADSSGTHPAPTANCATCHTPPASHYVTRCATCHTHAVPFAATADPHKLVGADCVSCHPVPASHPSGLVCTTCHTSPGSIPWTAATHPAQTAACVSCHTAPTPHFGTNGSDCAKCHSPAVPFADTVSPHVEGANTCLNCHVAPAGHPAGQCSICHNTDVPFASTPHPAQQSNCLTCHTAPAGHPAGTCGACHSIFVPFKDTPHPPRTATCTACHTAPAVHFGTTGSDCATCHDPEVPFTATVDPHATGAGCVACHAAPADHPSGLTCTACHTAPGSAPWTAATHPDRSAPCATCHAAPPAHQGGNGNCAGCHTPEVPFAETSHPGQAINCLGCHTMHPLGVAHPRLDCSECHVPHKAFMPDDAACNACHGTSFTHPDQAASCTSCHTPPTPHFGTTGSDCAICHSPVVPFTATTDPHAAETGCVTCHAVPASHPAGLTCVTCHTGPGSTPWSSATHPAQTATCAACHAAPAGHFGNNGADCAVCHNPSVPFTGTTDPHAARTDCVTCHASPSDHPSGLTCTACHTAPGKTPWTAASHPGQAAACASCHTAPVPHFGTTGTDCATCHSPAVPFASTADPHVVGAACAACHATPASHPANLTCTNCHAGPGSIPWSSATHPPQTAACASCHTAPAVHFGNTGTDCAKCHSPAVPFAATADPHVAGANCVTCHAAPSNHPAGLTCTTCHTGPGSTPWNSATHPAQTAACTTCHTPPTPHYGSDCADCHSPAVPFAETMNVHVPGVDCASCHTPPHASYLPTKCSECHAAPGVAWTPIAHPARTDCTTCHALPLNHPAGLTCTGCHVANANTHWSDASHPATGSTCTSCHALPGNHPAGLTCTQCHALGTQPFSAAQHPGSSTDCASCHSYTDHPMDGIYCEDCHGDEHGYGDEDCYDCHNDPEHDNSVISGSNCNGCHTVGPDTTPPTSSSNALTAYVSTATVTVYTADDRSGGATAHYVLDGGPEQLLPSGQLVIAPPASGSKSHTLEFWAVDASGNTETSHHTAAFTVAKDTTPPVTTMPGLKASYVGIARLRFSATDDATQYGVKATHYRVDGGADTVGTAADMPNPTVTATHTVEYWSVDFAGNEETHHNASFQTSNDSVPPTTTPAFANHIGPDGTPWITFYRIFLTLNATDTGDSGVAYSYALIDGIYPTGGASNGSLYTNSANDYTFGEGMHTLDYWSIDAAGNRETTKHLVWGEDWHGPNTTSDYRNNYAGPAVIHITATDAVSGVNRISYRIDSGSYVDVTGSAATVTIAPPASGQAYHTIYWTAYDNAGNGGNGAAGIYVKPLSSDVTPPLPGTVVINGGASSVATMAVTLTLSATDVNRGDSGVAQMQFSNDNSTWSGWEPYATTKAWTLSSGNGTKNVYAHFKDSAGNLSSTVNGSITLSVPVPDTTPPVTVSSSNPATGAILPANLTVTLTPADAGGSGLAATYWKVDGGSFAVGTTFTVTGDGPHTFSWYSKDNAGNAETVHVSNQFTIDTAAPSTSIDATNGQTYAGSQTFHLTATDAGSGVAASHFKLDGGAWTTGTVIPVTAPASGSAPHSIAFYSTDNAGQVETQKIVTITVTVADSVPPVTASSFNPAAGANYRTSQIVTLTPSDGGSGIKATYWKVDGGSYASGTSFTISGDGLHVFSWYSVDNANNTETVHASAQFRIDATAPVTSVSAVEGHAYTGSQDFTLSASDAGSGVDKVWYRLDVGAWTVGTAVAVTAPASGSQAHTVSYYSTDAAGNTETTKSVSFTVAAAAVLPSSGSVGYSYTGSDQSFTVPAGVTTVSVDLSGAEGGSFDTVPGGKGGGVHATIPVTAGQVLTVRVGGKPADGQQMAGGWPNGGDSAHGGAGGGSTSILRSGSVLVEAGAGGGADHNDGPGGDGGYQGWLPGGNDSGGSSSDGAAGGGGWNGGSGYPYHAGGGDGGSSYISVGTGTLDIGTGSGSGSASISWSAPPADTTAPVTASSAAAGHSYAGDQNFTLTASDGGSGVAGTWWQLDGTGGNWNAGTSVAVAAPASGSAGHTLYFYSKDAAGNTETTKSVAFTVTAAGSGSGETLYLQGDGTSLGTVAPASDTALWVSGNDWGNYYYADVSQGSNSVRDTSVGEGIRTFTGTVAVDSGNQNSLTVDLSDDEGDYADGYTFTLPAGQTWKSGQTLSFTVYWQVQYANSSEVSAVLVGGAHRSSVTGVVDTAAAPSGKQSFAYTGSTQSFTVPSGVTTVAVALDGAQGGEGWNGGGGAGGHASAVVTVVPGTTYTVRVGGAGAAYDSDPNVRAGGWPNGGNGWGDGDNPPDEGSGGGGGSSSLSLGSSVLAEAGGGGGGSDSSSGGAGGAQGSGAGGNRPGADANGYNPGPGGGGWNGGGLGQGGTSYIAAPGTGTLTAGTHAGDGSVTIGWGDQAAGVRSLARVRTLRIAAPVRETAPSEEATPAVPAAATPPATDTPPAATATEDPPAAPEPPATEPSAAISPEPATAASSGSTANDGP